MVVLLHRAACSTAKWEKKWLRYILDSWSRDPVDWSSPDIIYQSVTIYSRAEYLGETQIGLQKRGGTHIRQAKRKSGKMKLYGFMRSVGPHVVAWLPVKSWSGPVRPTKTQRLEAEAEEIFYRQSELNEIGRSKGNEKANIFGERMLLGKERRGRQLIKFRVRKRMEEAFAGDTSEVLNRPSAPRQALKALPLVMQMARRPWKPGEQLESRVALRLRQLKVKELGRLVSLGQSVLDATGRSIFWKNLQLVFRGHRQVAVVAFKVKSVLFALGRTEQMLLRRLRRWAAARSKRGVFLVLRVTLTLSRGESLLTALDNTSIWGHVPPELRTIALPLP